MHFIHDVFYDISSDESASFATSAFVFDFPHLTDWRFIDFRLLSAPHYLATIWEFLFCGADVIIVYRIVLKIILAKQS